MFQVDKEDITGILLIMSPDDIGCIKVKEALEKENIEFEVKEIGDKYTVPFEIASDGGLNFMKFELKPPIIEVRHKTIPKSYKVTIISGSYPISYALAIPID